MRSRYDLMSKSSQLSEKNTHYPDIMTFAIEEFTFNDAPMEYYLKQTDIERPDVFMSRMYGYSEFDDILLWLNHFASIDDASVGDLILLPSKTDLEKFYLDNRR